LEPVIVDLRRKLDAERLAVAEAARQIGVTTASLQRHLGGAYVRSDSLAKYRRWLAGESKTPSLPTIHSASGTRLQEQRSRLFDVPIVREISDPERPHYIVDLFSGCGGLALGFDLAGSGQFYRTILALDIEEPMVRAFNDNILAPATGSVCRRLDLSDFLNEAEVLAFYLDHLSSITENEALQGALNRLPGHGLSSLKSTIAALDDQFLMHFTEIKACREYRAAADAMESSVMGQTSVVGFQQALGLPPLVGKALLPPLVWSQPNRRSSETVDPLPPEAGLAPKALRTKWEFEVAQLRQKAKATGHGQLASSARRIGTFLKFLASPALDDVRDAWINWRLQRDALRSRTFRGPAVLNALRRLYSPECQVSIVLGGPPCQGFSRIGRGKIRSLREHGVHVQADAEAGDERNKLLLKYTLFVAALRPSLFLFENVRHFQAEVKTPEGVFRAPDLLAEAIKDISGQGAEYAVAMSTIDCSQHLVPQTRERFVMTGVRRDIAQRIGRHDLADWLLALPRHEPVPLRVALAGLPAPLMMGDSGNGVSMSRTVVVHLDPSHQTDPANRYLNWVRQPRTGSTTRAEVDGHVVRAVRADDGELFRMMGPGKRWMDYRCDDSTTLVELRALLGSLRDWFAAHSRGDDNGRKRAAVLKGWTLERVSTLETMLDGSLSLRLLLENMPSMPGELHHHLLAPGYLAKREGNHGDWLARLDPERPSKTIVSHMGKDTYAYVHPFSARSLSVREAARIQTFPDWFKLGSLGLVDAFRVIGNAVPPLLSSQFAEKAAQILYAAEDPAFAVREATAGQ
jgi:site-specific DNA-cytosine methylase